MAKSGKQGLRTRGANGTKGSRRQGRHSSGIAGRDVGLVPDRADMTAAQKIAWFSILADDLHRADRDEQLDVAARRRRCRSPSTSSTSSRSSCSARSRSSRSRRGRGTSCVEGGRIRRTKVDYVILALLAWIAAHDRSPRSIRPPPSSASTGASRGCSPSSTTRRSSGSSRSSSTGQSRAHASPRRCSGRRCIVAFYGHPAVPGPRPRHVGHPALRGEPLVLDLRQPRPARRLPHVLARDLARTRALREGDPAGAASTGSASSSRPSCWITAFTRGAWIGGVVALAIIVFAAIRFRAQARDRRLRRLGAVGVGSRRS